LSQKRAAGCAGRGDTATGRERAGNQKHPFFPDVDPKRVREEMRLEQTVSPRLRRAIKTAIAETNAELSDWREIQLDAGYATLADVPTDELDGESVRVFHYFNAVCSMTTATL
jgi:hypothetical protein